MAYVKHNEDVKNEQDLQNLIVGIVLRMEQPYKSEKIVELSKFYLKGSQFFDKIELIKSKVDEFLDFCQRRNIIARDNGTCYPRDFITNRFPREYYEARNRTTPF